MTQISKTNIAPLLQQEIYNQFYWVISQCQGTKEVNDLLSELLTKTERTILAKRLFIAVLLVKGYSYRNIRSVLAVSFPTIRMVSFWLEHGANGYKRAVEKIISIDTFNKTLAAVDKHIDKQ